MDESNAELVSGILKQSAYINRLEDGLISITEEAHTLQEYIEESRVIEIDECDNCHELTGTIAHIDLKTRTTRLYCPDCNEKIKEDGKNA